MSILIKDMDVSLRPRERLKKYGVSSLGDDELLAILLRCGTKSISVKDLSLDIIKRIGNLNNLENATLEELTSVKGVKEAKAITILAAIELGKRVLKKDNSGITINNNRMVYDLLKYDFINAYQESFIALFLDTKNKLIDKKELFKGTISSSTIHPREIFKLAVKHSAYSIIVAHNHPSGNSMPSQADIDLTNKLMESGKMIGIPVIDHIIIGNNNYYSFYDNKRIDIDD